MWWFLEKCAQLLPQAGRAVVFAAAMTLLATLRITAWAAVSRGSVAYGVWLMDAKAAVQIFDCDGLLCGRILWLQIPRDPHGQLNRDKNNLDPALRQRQLCGLTILWNLRPTKPDRWADGWFYNPDDGKTYRVSAQLKSADVISARIYLSIPFFGETKTLSRVPHGTSEGWC